MPRIMEITDLNSPELDLFARTSEVQLLRYFEPAPGIFLVESPKVISRALDDSYEPISLMVDRSKLQEKGIQSVMERCGDIPAYTAELDVLKQLTGFNLMSGMLCAMRRKPLLAWDDVCEGTRRIAVLERVTNPTNIGAIFRSAAALNMDAVLLTRDCSDPLYRRSVRVSMGTVFQIPWTFWDKKTSWPGDGMDFLKKAGFQTVAMALKNDSIRVDDPRPAAAERLAILFGSEGDGLMDETIAHCDYTVRIPMSHGVDSLNVAAASAVAFWELGR